jgi:CheY-like chemotaxis protein
MLPCVRVLLVEDNPAEARLIRETLADAERLAARPDSIELTHVETLAAALDALRRDSPDAVLLDLNLAESRGLETFRTLFRQAPSVPVVVLTGVADGDTAIQAVREGAQDYLVKGAADGPLVERSLRYAVERRRAEEAIVALQRAEQRERELRAFQRLSASSTAVTSAALGVTSLRHAAPTEFDALCDEYAAVAQLALERRGYRVDHDLSAPLRAVADRLGFLGAGPRDVVELHSAALRNCLSGATAARAQALLEETRVLLVELMGLLISYYRTYRHHAP